MKNASSGATSEKTIRPFWTSETIVGLTGVCVRNPIPCLAVALGLTAVALFFVFCYLQFVPANFRQSLNPNSRAAILHQEFFGDVANPIEACVVVEQSDSSTTAADVEQTLKAICAELLDRPEFFNVIARGLDGESFPTNRLFFCSPEEYEEAEGLASLSRAIDRGDWSQFSVDAVANDLTERVGDDLRDDLKSEHTIDSVTAFSRALAEITTARTVSPETTPSPVAPGVEANVPSGLAPNPYYLFQSKTALGGGVMFNFVDDLSPEDQRRAVNAVEMIVERTRATHPRTIVEATGLPFIEKREFIAFMHAARAWGVFFVAAIVVFFWAFFGAASRPFIVLAALLAGGSWTLCFQTAAFHELSPDSVHFWIVILSVAIVDSAVYLAKYSYLRRNDRSASEAIMATASTAGASLASFALVMCVASLAFAFTNVVNRTFSVMVGVGIALTCLATLVVLPTLLKLVDGARPFRGRQASSSFDFEQANPYLRTIAVAGLIIGAIVCLGVAKVKNDPTRSSFHNLRFENIRTQETASQYLESRTLYGVLFADSAEEARKLAARIDELQGSDELFYVENVAEEIPDVDPDEIVRVEAIGDALKTLKPEIGEIPVPPREKLVAALEALRDAAKGAFQSRSGDMAIDEYLTGALERIAAFSDDELDRRMDVFSRLVAIETLKRLHLLKEESDARAPSMDDLSDALRERYVGQKTGRVILRVYSLRTLADALNLVNFVAALREIDPDATGPAVLIHEQGLQAMKWNAAYYSALILVFAILAYIRFRSFRASFAAILTPLIVALEIVGIAGLLGISLNPINEVVLPMGVILALYSALRFAEDYDETPEYFFSRERALSTCVASTAIAGFFCFGLACPEAGWQNFARLGILSTAVYAGASLVILPALLNWSAIQPVEESVVGVDESEADDEEDE